MTIRGARIRPTITTIAVCAFLCGAQLAIEAPQAAKLYRIGVLDVVGAASNEANLSAFRQGLRELGYVEGQNLVIEYRSADGRAERFPDLATELVRLRVDVIVTRGTSAALGAKHVTETIPIVMASSGDPIFAGLVASLARPGGNVTGLHVIVPPQLAGTRLQLLKEVMPGLSRVGVLLDSGDVYSRLMMREIERVAHAIGVQLQSVDARRPADFERAFEAAILDRVDALITVEGVLTSRRWAGSWPSTDSESLWRPGASWPTAPTFAISFVAPPPTSTESSRAPNRQTSRWSRRPSLSW